VVRRLICWLACALVGLAFISTVPATATAARAPIGGAELHYLPRGLGASTDFDYEFDDVSFAARVWESGSDTAGWRVDLEVIVLRGARLSSPQVLHDWFLDYEARPPAEARYRPTRVHEHRGWACRDEVFWLVRPAVAVAVRIDRDRWSATALDRTARGIRVRG
jgi:hypothetical protein